MKRERRTSLCMSLKKVKGFSLIELIIVLSIIVIIVGLSSINFVGLYNGSRNSTNVSYFNNKILHIISESALYCKSQNKSGYLLFSDDSKKIKFFCNNIKIKEYEAPNKFIFINTDSFHKRIGINNLGSVIQSCTINYIDEKGETHIITIRVATRYVQIK
jgi:prepilin-type N-terminal cleavage/methylation domain-containing protein